MKIPQSVHELLPKAPLTHLTTLNSDGGPQVTVVWVGIENEEYGGAQRSSAIWPTDPRPAAIPGSSSRFIPNHLSSRIPLANAIHRRRLL